MTVQNLDAVAAKKGDTMQQADSDKQSKSGHISFSVASLLADTRPARSESPTSRQSSDYDSNQEDSIVDVEDLNSDRKSEDAKESEYQQPREVASQGPIRPTPFSALAAAVYQANWSHQGLVNPFGGPGSMFQNATPFGVPGMNPGR